MEEPKETLKEYVVRSLARMMDRDEIITEVCLRLNCSWGDGEDQIYQIEQENAAQLQKRKGPLLLVASALFALAGFCWAVYSFYGLVFPIYVIWKEQGGLAHGVLWIYDFWRFFPQLLMSTGMAVSGMLGVVHAVKGLRGEIVEEPF
ncbi:MAG: hypothetical protein C0410_06600 [Anaerolinea sp.]|nr:hypothetical protein [Anaerolinea sp.]